MSQFLSKLSALDQRLSELSGSFGYLNTLQDNAADVEIEAQKTIKASKKAVRQYIVATREHQGGLNPDGPPGLPGLIGPPGLQGVAGPKGPDSLVLEEGPQGPQGEVGDQGPVGNQGVLGLQGTVGDQGEVGDQGPQGEVGDQGVLGLQGTVGDQGVLGDQGPQGEVGDQGEVGSADSPGFARVPSAISSRVKGSQFLFDRHMSLTRNGLSPNNRFQGDIATSEAEEVWTTEGAITRLASASGYPSICFDVGTLSASGVSTINNFGIFRFVVRRAANVSVDPQFTFGTCNNTIGTSSANGLIPGLTINSGNGRQAFTSTAAGNIRFQQQGKLMGVNMARQEIDLGIRLTTTWRTYIAISLGVVAFTRTFRILVTEGYLPGGEVVFDDTLTVTNRAFYASLGAQCRTGTLDTISGIDILMADSLMLT